MALIKSFAKEMECSICTEVFTDPRVLPCGHIFCIHCLQSYCKDKQPSKPCPLCRREFTIPDNGIPGLPKYIYTSEALRKLVVSDTEKVTNFLEMSEEVLTRLEKEKNDVMKHVAGIKDEINTAADKLIAAIQRDREKLLSEVGSIRLKRVKQLETVKQEVEQHMTALERFRRDCETLLSSGTACDVTRSANSLHDRADELMKFDVIGHIDSSLPPMNVTFTSSTLLDRDDRNLVGTVQGQFQFFEAGKIKTSILLFNQTC